MRRSMLTLLIALLVAATAGAQEGDSHDATVQRSFDDVERWVKVFDAPDRDEWQKPRTVLEFLGVLRGDEVADLGAGTGYFTHWLGVVTGEEGAVFAVDIEKSMIDYIANERDDLNMMNVIPILADPDDPKLPPDRLQLVLIANTWHHMNDRVNYLSKLEPSLRLSGRVAVIDWDKGDMPVGPPEEHRLSREAVIAEFEEAGWSFTSESTALPYQYFLIFHPPRH